MAWGHSGIIIKNSICSSFKQMFLGQSFSHSVWVCETLSKWLSPLHKWTWHFTLELRFSSALMSSCIMVVASLQQHAARKPQQSMGPKASWEQNCQTNYGCEVEMQPCHGLTSLTSLAWVFAAGSWSDYAGFFSWTSIMTWNLMKVLKSSRRTNWYKLTFTSENALLKKRDSVRRKWRYDFLSNLGSLAQTTPASG